MSEPDIRHPQQPDGIAADGGELPDAARAARRVRAWICQWGDGLIDVAGQRPLYARDLAALVRTVQDELPAARAELARTAARGCDECSVEPGERHRYPRCPGASSEVSDARADLARMTDTAEGLSVALTRATRERDEARARADRLAETLREALAGYYERGHPGYPALRTGWTREERVTRWRQVLDEQPTPTADRPAAGWIQDVVALADRIEAALREVDPEVMRLLFRSDLEAVAERLIGPPPTTPGGER